MRNFSTLAITLLALTSSGQTLFFEDFEDVPEFTLNTSDAGSVANVSNTWLVNNVYGGGNGVADCLGFPLDFTIPATAAQPVGITGPGGRYLHTASIVAVGNGIQNCSFGAADGFCTDPDDIFARMSIDVSTVGSTDVSFTFWWLCNGGNQNYGEVYYSTNSGASWTQVTVPLLQYRNTTTWSEQTISLPAFGDQPTLRFGFRFHNGTSLLGGSDPGFAIDDVRIIASDTEPATVSCSIAPLAFCQGASADVLCAITGTFNPGNVFTVQLSDASGSFGSPVTIGSLPGTTGGVITCSIPLGTPPGAGYRVRVVSSSPVVTGPDNGANIAVFEAPYAGTGGSLSICSGQDPVTMASGGDSGGTWTGPSPVVGDLYDPATMDPGTYTYTVASTGPCGNDQSTFVVTEVPGANAGTSTSVVICKNTGTYDLIDLLDGSPDPGGTWTAPGGGASNGTFNSNTQSGGVYTYTVAPGGSCPADEAVVSVQLGLPGEAGPNEAWSACSNDLPLNLFSLLDGSANLTGVWFSDGAPFNGVVETGGDFLYIDYADAPCSNDTASIALTVVPAADAGLNGTVTVCANAGPIDLFEALGGEPDVGGVWTGPDNLPHGSTFDPAADDAGLYTYTVAGSFPCPDDEALLAVIVDPCTAVPEEGNASGRFAWLGSDQAGVHHFQTPRAVEASVAVFDVRGRVLRDRAHVGLTGTWSEDGAGLAPGIYTLRFTVQDVVHVVRFVQ